MHQCLYPIYTLYVYLKSSVYLTFKDKYIDKRMLSVWVLLVMVSALTVPCLGYSLGPPLRTCVKMWPKHRADAQTTAPPYTITLSKDTYTPGEELTGRDIYLDVTKTYMVGVVDEAEDDYSSGAPGLILWYFYKSLHVVFVNTTDLNPEVQNFTGLMIQARRANCSNEEAVGSFKLESDEDFLGLLDCPGGTNSSVAHKTNGTASYRTFKWIAPSTTVGQVYFRGTIVSVKKTFWTTVKSTFIRDSPDSAIPESCVVKTTQEDSDTNSANIRKFSNLVILVTIATWWFRI